MTREELIRRGEAARRLLNEPLALAALDEIAAECSVAWAASNPTDTTAREDAYRLQRCVALVRQKLETWTANAAVERENAALRLAEARNGT
jgi:hypothetical protein